MVEMVTDPACSSSLSSSQVLLSVCLGATQRAQPDFLIRIQEVSCSCQHVSCYSAAVASCPARRRRWLLARSSAAARRWPLRCHMSSNVLRTNSEGWRVSKFRKCRARCGESRTNADKSSKFALIVKEVLLQ